MRSAILWVTALAAASVTATPWGSRANQKCASYCKESDKFIYEPGTIYTYDYTAETATQISGTSDEESRLHISAKAEFEAISPCELVLRVKGVKLEESDPRDASARSLATGSERFAGILERQPLLFAFQDGVVEHMCPSVDEETWSLNIKRGILSAFQNSMENLSVPQKVHEIDITGHCETNYTVVGQGRRGVTIRKTKDLLSCTGRNSHVSAIQSTPYTSASPVQSLPLMKCENECHQVVTNKRLEKTTCTEIHMFQPFSNGNSGALTRVSQSLVFSSEKQSTEPSTDMKRTRSSLMFVNEEEQQSLAGRENVAIKALNELVSTSKTEITSDVPKFFSKLVTVLKPLSYNQLSKILYNTKDSRARKYLIDAAPLLGTSASMALMRDLIRDQLVSEVETDMWLSSLAFHPKPSIDMIVAVTPLVTEQPREKALLGISAMINTYCRSNANCNSNPDILNVVREMEKILGSGCRSVDDKQQREILTALKALGNAGVIINPDVLKRCYEENNPMPIRLAAIDAIRRVPCGDVDRSPLLTFFRNMNQDPELRIGAYLAIMRCPTPQLLDEVKQALVSEAVNQVGSFIWTHLTNLQETSSPSKQQIRQMLSSDFLKNKFNTDVRKFSRNFEASTFFEELNVGGTVESNIIFSSKSYLPRSAMLNFTIDLFGESINLLEIGARVEGFESLVESFFGPNGIVPEENLKKALQTIRGKREVDENSINQLSATYNVANEVVDEPEGNFYMRIFGNELVTKDFKGLSMKNKDSPLSMLLQNAGKNTEFTKSFMFVDTSYSVPTIVGLPLSLTLNGTATVSMRMGGKFEVDGISNVNIVGHFKPSAATEINGVMSVDAFVTRSGIQIQNVLHSSTGIDGKVIVKGKDVISVQFNMPQEKIEIFSRKSNLLLLHKGTERPIQAKQTKVMSKSCSADNLSKLLGIEFCGEYEYHPSSETAPRRPLNGPSNVAIYIQKTDTHTGYTFDYKFNVEQIKRQKVRTISVALDTPNSRINRRIAAQVVLDEPAKSVRALLQSPLNNLDFSGKYEFNEMLKSADLVLSVNKNEYATVRAAWRSDVKGNSGRFEPTFVVTRKGRELMSLQGFYNFVQGSKYGFDLQLKQLTARPIRLTGDVTTDGSKYDANLAIKSYFIDTSMVGNVRVSDKVFSSKFKSDYSFFEATTQQVEISAKYGKTVKGALQKITVSGVVQTSQFPEYSTDFSWDIQTSTNYVENTGRIVVGKTQWDIQQLYSSQSVRGQQDLTLKAGISCPKKDIDIFASYVQGATDSSLTSTALLRTSPGKEWSSHLELVRKYSPVQYSGRMELSSPTQNFQLRSELVESQSNQWDALAAFTVNKQQETSFTASFKNLSTAIKAQYAVELKARGPYVENVDASGEFSASVSQTSLTFAGKYANDKVSAVLEYNVAANDEHSIEARLNSNDTPVLNSLIIVGFGTEKTLVVDIKSGRHITLNAKIVPGGSSLSTNIEFFWDKERNLGKMFSFAGQLRGGSGTATLKYPGRVISLKANFKGNNLDAEVEWEEGKKITISLDIALKNAERRIAGSLITPFAGYEKVSFETSNSNLNGDAKTQISVNWRREKIGIIVSSIQNSERLAGAVAVESTFTGFENVRLGIDAVYSTSETKFTATLSENGRSFEFVTSCSRQNGSFSEAVVSLTTPVVGLEVFKIQVDRQVSIEGFDVKAELAYPGDKLVTGTASVKKTSREISGHAGLKTPFDFARAASSSFRYETDGNVKKLSLSSEFNDQRGLLEGSFTNQGPITAADIVITTPFTEEISAALSHTFDGRQLKSSVQLTLAPSKKIAASIEGRAISSKDIDVTATVKSLFNESSFRLVNRVENSSLKTVVEAVVNGKTAVFNVNAEARGDEQSRQIRADTSLVTPLQGLRDIRVNLDYNRNSKNILTVFKIVKDESSIEFQHSLKCQGTSNWENIVEMATPFEGLQSIRITSQQTSSDSASQHQTEGSFNGKRFAATLNTNKALTRSNSKYAVSGAFTSDWTEEFNFDFQHEDDGKQFHPTIVLRTSNAQPLRLEVFYTRSSGSKTVKVDITSAYAKPLTAQVGYVHTESSKKSFASLIWDSVPQIKFDSDVAFSGNSGYGKAFLITPFVGIQDLSLDANYDLSGVKKTAAAVFGYNGRKVQINSFAGAEASLYEAQVSVNTPFESFEILMASANFDVATRKGKIALKRGDREITLEGTALMAGNQLSVAAAVTSPFVNFENIKLEGRLDLGSNSKSLRVNLDVNGKRSDLEGSFVSGKKQGSLNAQIALPINGLRSVTFTTGYDFSKAEKAIFSTIQHGNDALKLKAEGTFEASVGKFSATIDAPALQIQNAVISGGYSKDSTKKAGQVNLQLNGKKVELDGSLTTPDNSAELVLNAATNVKGFESISLNAKLNNNKSEKSAYFTAAKNSHRIEATGKFNMRTLQKLEASLDVKTPFEQFTSMQLVTKYDFRKAEKLAEIVATRNSESVKLVVSGNISGLQGKLNGRLTTSISGLELLSGEVTFNLEAPQKSFAAIMENNNNRKDLNLNLRVTNSNIEARLVTPFAGYELITVTGEYSLSTAAPRLVVSVSKNNSKFELNGSGSFNSNQKEITIDIHTPVQEWEALSTSVTINVVDQEKVAIAKLKKNNKYYNIELNGSFSLPKSDVKINVLSSCDQLKSFSFQGSYDVRDAITGSLSIEKNGEVKSFSGEAVFNTDNAKIALATPFEGYRNLGLTGKLTSNSNEKAASLNLQNGELSTDFGFSLSFDQNSASFAIRMPIQNFENIAAQVRFNPEARTAMVSVSRNEDRIEISGSVNLRASAGDASLRMTSTIKNFDLLDLSAKYSINSKSKSVSVSAVKSEKTFELGATYAKSRDSMQIGARMTTPFKAYEQFSTNVEVNFATNSIRIIGERNGVRHEISGSASWSAQNIAANLSTTFSGLESFGVNIRVDDKQLEFTASTPIVNYESVSFNVEYDVDSANKFGRFVLVLGSRRYENEFSLQLEKDLGNFSARLQVPFVEKSMRSTVNYNFQDSEKSASVFVENDKVHFETGIKYRVTENSATGALHVQTPFAGYEELDVNGSYDLTEQSFVLVAERNGKTEVRANCAVGFSALSGNAALQLNLPVIFATEFDGAFSYEIAKDFSSVDASLKIQQNNIRLKVDQNQLLSGTVSLTSTYDMLQNARLAWNLSNMQSLNVALDVNDQTVKAIFEAKVTNLLQATVRASLATPYFTNQVFNAEWNAVKKGKFSGRMSYDSGYSNYLLASEIAYGTTGSADITIKTPVSSWEEISFKGRYANKKDIAADASLSLNQKQLVEASFSGKLNWMKSNLKASVSSPAIGTVSSEFAHDFTATDKSASVSILHNLKRVQIDLTAGVYSLLRANGRLSLATPLTELNNVILHGSYDVESDRKEVQLVLERDAERSEIRANFETSTPKGSSVPSASSASLVLTCPCLGIDEWRIEGSYDTSNGLSATAVSTWAPEKAIRAAVGLSSTGLTAKVNTPFEGYQSAEILTSFDFSSFEQYVQTSISFGDKKTTFAAFWTFKSPGMDFRVTLTTTFQKYENIEFRGSYDASVDRKASLTYSQGGRSVELFGSVVASDDGSQAKLSFSSPSGEFEEVTATFEYNLSASQKSASMVLRRGSDRIAVSILGELGAKLTGLLNIEAPFMNAAKVSVDVPIAGDDKNIRIAFEYGEKKIELTGTIIVAKSGSKIRGSITTPFSNFKKMNANIRTTQDSFDISIEYARGKTIQLNGSYQFKNSEYRLSANLQTPFAHFENLAINTVTDLSSGFNGRASLQWAPEKKIEISTVFDEHKASFALQTPFEVLSNLKLHLQYQINLDYIVGGSFEWNEYQGSFEGRYVSSSTSTQVGGHASWNWKTISVETLYNDEGNNKNAYLNINTPFEAAKSMGANFQLQRQGNQLKTVMTINTPFSTVPSISGSADVNFDVSKILQVSIAGSAADKTVSFRALASRDANKYSTALQMDLPFVSSMRLFGFTADLEYNPSKNINGAASITLPGGEYQVKGSLNSSRKEVHVTGSVSTPSLTKDIKVGGEYDINTDKSRASAKLYMWDNVLTAQYTVSQNQVNANARVVLPACNKNIGLNLETNFRQLRQLDAVLTLDYNLSTHKAAFGYQLTNGKFMGQLELDTPILQTKKILTTLVKFGTPSQLNVTIEGKLMGSDSHEVYFSISTVKTLKAEARISCPTIANGNAVLEIGSKEGKLSIQTTSGNHRVQYTLRNDEVFDFTADAESPLLSSPVSIRSYLRTNDKRYEGSVTLQYAGDFHTVTGECSHADDSINTAVKMESPLISGQSASVEATYLNKNRIDASLTLTVLGKAHRLSGVLENQPRYSVEVRADSYLLPWSTVSFTAHTKTSTSTMEAEANLTYGDKSVSLSANTRYAQWNDLSASFSLNTPYEKFSFARADLHLLTLNGLSLGAEIQTSLPSVSQFALNAKYQINEDAFEASSTVSVPLKNWEDVSLTIIIPLSGDIKRFSTKLSTPVSQHFISGEFTLTQNRLELRAEGNVVGKKGSIAFLLAAEDFYELKIDVTTPFREFEKYSWDLKGAVDIKRWGEAVAYFDWNGKRIEFTSNIKAENLAYITVFQLNTPFTSYDRFALHVRIEGTERKTLHVELEYPGSRLGAEFDYVFNSFTDFICKSSINTPFTGYDRFSVAVSNRLTPTSYSGNAEARFVNYGVSFNIDAAMKESAAEISVETRYNEQVAVFKASGGYSSDAIDGSLTLNTPFDQVRNVDGFVHIEKDPATKNSGFGISVNGNKVFLVSISSLDGNRVVEIYNPIRPVAISYSFEYGSSLTNIEAQLCWDLNQRAQSSLGAKLIVKNVSQGKQISLKTLVPGRVVNLEYAHVIASGKIDQTLSVSWTEGKSAGYKIFVEDASSRHRTQLDVVVRVDLPVRSFEVESHHIVSDTETSSSVEMKWDAARDRSKRMGARIETSNLSTWTKDHRKAALIIIHSALEQDIALRGEYSKVNGGLFGGKVELIYSPFEDQTFVAETTFGQAEKYVFSGSIRHPASRLDLQVNSEASLETNDKTGKIRVDYLSKSGSSRFFQLDGKLGQQIELGVRTTEKSALFTGSFVRSRTNYQVASRLSLNDDHVYVMDAQIDTKSPVGRLSLTSPSGSVFSVNAGLPSDREISARVSRDVMGKSIIDGQLNIKLNTSEIFSSRIYWRPNSATELRAGASSLVFSTVATVKSIITDTVAFISEEAVDRKVSVLPSMAQLFNQVIDYERAELNAIAADFSGMVTYFNVMYKNNEMYIRDAIVLAKRVTAVMHPQLKSISRNIQATYNMILGDNSAIRKAASKIYTSAAFTVASAWKQTSLSFGTAMDILVTNFDEVTAIFSRHYIATVNYAKDACEWIQKLRSQYIGRMEEIVMAEVEKLRKATIDAVSAYAEIYKPYIEKATVLVKNIQKQYELLKNNYNDFAGKVKQHLMKYAPLKRVFNLWVQYASWLEEFQASEYIEMLNSYIEKVVSDGRDRLNAATSRYRPYIEAVSQAIEGQMTTIKQIPIVAYISTVAERAQFQIQEFWKYVELEEKLRNVLRDALRHADLISSQFASDLDGSFDISFNPIYVFDPQNGRIELTLYLPVQWTSLYEAPQFMELPLIKKTSQAKKNFFESIDVTPYYYSVMDALATYRPLLNLDNVIPPFSSHAMIAGTQHYMTFDKKFYEFAGECSYLLVSDFVNNNFSAVVNYEGTNGKVTRKSLTVLSNGRQIDIDSAFRITVNGRKVELPIAYEKTSVKRDGHRVIVSNENGFRVECNLHQDLCTVHVTGWNFGKTGGLFGVYNHEARDDFLTPFRQLRTDAEVDSFAHSWKVGTSRCRVRNYAIESASPTIRNSRLCDELFVDEASTLRPCFRKVDPTPFVRMCLNDLAALENSPKKDLGVCTAASAYVTECRAAGIDLWVPSKCVRCEVDNSNVMSAGDIKTYNGDAPRSADVVFIVDQKTCLKNTRLSSLPIDLDASLKEQGINNNRFAVVGFGGKGIFNEPHIRTAEGHVWSNRKSIQLALEDMPLNGEKKSDVFAAIKYAANLQYRAGVSKQIILVTCENDCEATGYADALSILLENDIKVHLLQPRDLAVRGKQGAEEQKNIFGFDSEQVYTVRSVRRLAGDRELRRQMVIPKDFCTPLAMETNGTLFDVNKMSLNDPLLAKKFSDVFARRVALTAEPSECQRCDCVGDRDGVGSVVCQRCVPPSLDKFIKDWEKLAYENELINEALPEDFTVVKEIKDKSLAKNPKKGSRRQ